MYLWQGFRDNNFRDYLATLTEEISIYWMKNV